MKLNLVSRNCGGEIKRKLNETFQGSLTSFECFYYTLTFLPRTCSSYFLGESFDRHSWGRRIKLYALPEQSRRTPQANNNDYNYNHNHYYMLGSILAVESAFCESDIRFTCAFMFNYHAHLHT